MKNSILLIKRALSIWAKNILSFKKQDLTKIIFWISIKIFFFHVFRFFDLFHFFSFIIFAIFITIFHHGQGHWSFIKNHRSKISALTLKKSGLSSSDHHTSSAGNSTQTSILYIPYNEHINTNQKKNNISNTDDIQSCVTPQTKLQCSGHFYAY